MNTKAETKAQELAMQIAPDEKGYGPAIRLRLTETLNALTLEAEGKDEQIKSLQHQVGVLTSSISDMSKELIRLKDIELVLNQEKLKFESAKYSIQQLQQQLAKLDACLDKAANLIMTYRKSDQLNPDVVLRTLLSLVRSKDYTKES